MEDRAQPCDRHAGNTGLVETMPRKRKPARILYRKPRPGRGGRWVILDGGREYSTGAGSESEAERALGEYLVSKSAKPDSPQQRERITVGDCLTLYAEEHGPTVADPARMAWAIDALAPFWGEQPVSAVTANTCRRYARERKVGDGTVRRELGVLRASLNHCEREGYLVNAPVVTLPGKPAPKDRWLSRDEAAALLRATRRHAKTRHLARFILIGLYTGTRPGAIRALGWNPSTTGGHIDLAQGVLYRAPAAARQSNKRQTPVKLTRRLQAHLRRWHAMDGGMGPVVRYQGRAIAEVKSRTWQALCRAAGVEHCTPHVLRHTAATWMMQRGARPWDAAGFLGMTVETLESVYGHHSPNFQGSAVEAMEAR